jgi:hypothetical protein
MKFLFRRLPAASTAAAQLAALGALALLAALPQQAGAQSSCIQIPVDCHMTSAFGPRFNPITKNFSSEFHHGVDFGCPIGTPVRASANGMVSVSGLSQTAGNWVVATVPGGSPTVMKYMHHERNLVSAGTMVAKGQEIARTGNTGRSTGPHLHFQVEVNKVAVDPLSNFCTKPPVNNGVLQGADPPQGDTIDQGSQASAPGNDGGTPPPMGFDGGLFEILTDAIASRALNPDYMRQLSTLSEPRLYAELAFMQTIKLKVQHERAQHRERMEASQAMLQLLTAEAILRPQLDAQRRAATGAVSR